MKIEWHFEGVAKPEDIERHMAHAKSLGLPSPKGTGKTRLAVVGGSPSVLGMVEEIKAFDGDIWIISSAYPWATKNGINGVYFNIDPSPECAVDCIGATKAILGESTHPDVFSVLKGSDVSLFELVHTDTRLNHGVTTVTAVPELALLMDYLEIVFFGCESSFAENSHAYRNEMDTNKKWLIVESNGESFRTRPDYMAQAEYLATIIRRFPEYFKERSGGFLRAMVATMEYDVTHATRAMYNTLTLS